MACVELPAFPLQLLLKRHPDWAGRPVAVVDRDKPQGAILWINEEARAVRIRTGMRYSAGQSLAHTLHAGEVPPADIERGVAAIADRLRGFSPDVEPCQDEPGVFWLNASGLSRLHASPARSFRQGALSMPSDPQPRPGVGVRLGEKCGLGRWAQEIVASLRMCGFRAVVAVGFTRFGTCAIARTLTPGEPVAVIRDPAGERTRAGRVRLSRLGIDPALRDSLHNLGVRTVKAFLELPSDGVRRRFGPEAQRLHRLAAGELWAPLQPLRVAEPLVAHHDLDDLETDAVRLLFYLKRLLDRVLATVAARHQALAELTLYLRLDRTGTTHAERIRPAAPTLDVVQLMNLVRLRLESLTLGAGVVELRVTGRAVATSAVQQGLFTERPHRDRDAAERALARVHAEFGDEAVVRARLVEAHLPEARFAWEPTGTVPPPEPREVVCRPMVRRIHVRPLALPSAADSRPQPEIGEKWGLEPYPEPGCRSARDGEIGSVRELAGPYLVSGGWWRSAAHREYYFAWMGDGEVLWIYYDRPRRRWRWQGRVE